MTTTHSPATAGTDATPTAAPVSSPTVPMRDGVPYDTAARRKLADAAVKAQVIKQPRGIKRPPGPRGISFAARQLFGAGSASDFFAALPAKYPRITHWRLGGMHMYVLNDAELIDHVHRNYARVLTKSRALQEARVLVGNGLLTNEGQDHLKQRRLVQPAFHRKRIHEYSERMVAATVEHEEGWQVGERVDMAADMSSLTLDIVGRTLFGADLRKDAAEVGEALNNLLEAFPKMMLPTGKLMARIPGTALYAARNDPDELDGIVQRMIEEHRRAGDTGDLLSMLIEAQEDGTGMDDAQLRDEVMTLVIAGHETTAMNLTWTWYLLSQNPAVARRLREELARVLGGRAPTMDDLASLPYTRAVISESMRLFPPAWVIGRMTTEDIEIDGWQVPAGSVIMTSQYAMQRDPRYWDSALAFTPERWIDESGAYSEKAPGQPKGAWFPFGYGKRMCIGDQFALTEAALVVATLAQRWAPKLVPGSPVTPFAAVTLRPKDGMPMTLEPAPAVAVGD